MNAKKIALLIVRTLLALLFIFSGFVKGVDPWGSAIKFGEYFSSFGLDWLSGASYFFAVALSAAEMVLGLMLLFGVWMRAASVLVLIFMSFFTLLTLYIAVYSPVADCGCFGDAIKLTNWQTFLKNMLLLLPMSVFVWWRYRKRLIPCCFARNLALTLTFVIASSTVGIYALWSLPIIDFLPYKVGVNIPESMNYNQQGDVETTLIYKDKLSGDQHNFTLTDTTWYDAERWEYVDTKIVINDDFVEPKISGFAIFDYDGDATARILAEPEVVMICASDITNVKGACKDRLTRYVKNRDGYGEVICLTASSITDKPDLLLGDGIRVHCYNVDATTMKTMLRAKVGIIVLKNGTIESKMNCTQF